SWCSDSSVRRDNINTARDPCLEIRGNQLDIGISDSHCRDMPRQLQTCVRIPRRRCGKILTDLAIAKLETGAAQREVPDGTPLLYLIPQPTGRCRVALCCRFDSKP